MRTTATATARADRLSVAEVIERYGNCLELVPLDPHFHHISIGVYLKDGVATVWTFSRCEGAQERIRRVRDQIVGLGGLVPVEGTHDKVRFPCDHVHLRPLKFLMMQAVEKDPEYVLPEGVMSVKDTRTPLTLTVAGRAQGGRWVYTVSGAGQAPNVPMRLKAVVGGFVRYGEMQRVSDTEVAFHCGTRHDDLVRLLLPYARNMSAVDQMMEAAAMRGQLTTGTAGFTPV